MNSNESDPNSNLPGNLPDNPDDGPAGDSEDESESDFSDSGDDRTAKERRKKRRQPRKATKKSLENGALFYLQRFSTSAENLRRVLMRRVDRSARTHDTDPAEGAAWIDDIIERYKRSGLLDDRVFADARARTLLERGIAPGRIKIKLRQKGIDEITAEGAVAGLEEDTPDVERAAALKLARRRRLGPYRRSDRDDFREKDLAALARSGFSYDTALAIIDAETVEDAERLLDP